MAVTAATLLLRPGVRLWSADGLAATVAGYGPAGVLAVVDGEREPIAVDADRWRPAIDCEYCDQAAAVQLRDGQDCDVLCKACAHDQHDGHPAPWVRPIPRAVIRRLFPNLTELS